MNLNEGDPELLRAVLDARRTLPQFTDAFAKGRFAPATYLVKVPFIDRNEIGEPALVRTSAAAANYPNGRTCRLWLTVTSVLEDLLFCSVFESPMELRLATAETCVVDASLVEDWMIHHEGVAYGGFSMRVIYNRLPEHERRRFTSHTGISEFKELAS